MLVCRKQLEEMAEKFRFPSVRQFAVEILRGNSAQRLTWLWQYYTSLNHPDLSNTVTDNFPQPDSTQTSPSATSTKTAATESHADTKTLQRDFLKAQKNPKYTQKNPEPKTKPKNSHNKVSPKKPTNTQNSVQEPRKNQKISQKDILQLPSDVPSLESQGQQEIVCSARGHKRTKKGSVSGSGTFRAGGGLGLDQASSSGLRSGEAAAFLNCTDRDTPSSPDFGHGSLTMLSKPTVQGSQWEPKLSSRTSENFQGQRENPQTCSPPQPATPTCSHRSFLTDLIGDTSILDDLLKPKSRVAQQSLSSASVKTCITTPVSSRINLLTDSGSTDVVDSQPSSNSSTRPAQQAPPKGRRKDFWDILNEGNEESINRLTDLTEVQRVCISTNFAAGSRSGKTESKNLWKTNEKFLWKK